jgi:nucleoside-diphosphate-sugar epimerase
LAQVVVTGAAGFIGRALCRALVESGHAVRGLTRAAAEPIAGVALSPVGEIGPQTDWASRLAGTDIALHLATSAHRPLSAAAAAREADAAAALVRAAAAAGVGRLVLMSSVRAMGEATEAGRPFCAVDPPRPRDAYGKAKLAIEEAVLAAANAARLDLVVLRPPLVYGPAVKGNLHALIRLVASGIPLPFAGLDNRRSLIALDNLVDLLVSASTHPAAAGRVLLARDGSDLSTPQLIAALARGLGRRAHLYRVPAALLTGLRAAPVVRPAVSRLTLSLQLDDAETRRLVGWAPRVAPEAGLAAAAASFARRG